MPASRALARRFQEPLPGRSAGALRGGPGLFGPFYSITLRLAPRRRLERVVEIVTTECLMEAFGDRLRSGCLYGDFQFAIDPRSPDFLRRGVFACYRPVAEEARASEGQISLGDSEWCRLLTLAHTDKTAAFELYAEHYLATDGQLYWSDTHQLSTYVDDYHRAIDHRLGHRGSEVIGELYVRRCRLADFLSQVAEDFRRHRVDLVYGTVRLIERDDESWLAWAREPWACVVFNLHTPWTAAGHRRSRQDFRRLIGRAVERGGSFYLTYHRHARRDQIEACYPALGSFLEWKHRLDPERRFDSDWYRHLLRLCGGGSGR